MLLHKSKEKSRESMAKLNPLQNSIQVSRVDNFELGIKATHSPGVQTAENSQEELSPGTQGRCARSPMIEEYIGAFKKENFDMIS